MHGLCLLGHCVMLLTKKATGAERQARGTAAAQPTLLTARTLLTRGESVLDFTWCRGLQNGPRAGSVQGPARVIRALENDGPLEGATAPAVHTGGPPAGLSVP